MPESANAAYENILPLFKPRRMAVVGASSSGITPGNEFIRHSRALGFDGEIIPIHPSAAAIEGLPTLRSFADVQGIVDYAYIAVAAHQVEPVLAAAKGKLRFAQVMSSGFGEIEGGREAEERIVATARAGGIRVIGPNCLGVHSPRGKLTFVGGASAAQGGVGIVSQSGGLAVDLILRGRERGLEFSGVITMGNSADLGPADLLEFYLNDPETRAIGLYIEDVKDGRRFFEVLRAANGAKPVALLVGGRTPQGRLAAASHTGSLASDTRIWEGFARQTGAVLADTVDELIDILIAFQSLEPRRDRKSRSAVLFGNGGGTSVLATDAFFRRGIEVSPMAKPAVEALAELKLPPGTSILNPIDTPAGTLRQEEGRIAERILRAIFDLAQPDAVVMHVNLPVFLSSADQRSDVVGNLMQAALRAKPGDGGGHFLLVLRSDGSEATDKVKREYRRRAQSMNLPVYDELVNAATALAAMATYEDFATGA